MFTRPIRRLIRSAQKLLQLLLAIPQHIASAIANWFIRRAILAKRGYRRSPHWGNAGFVLPTAVLLTLVVALTVGALTFRTFSRTSDVITERQQRVIQNAATPAIDRAKAKIERLFSDDVRFPGGIPASDVLVSMMANDGQNGIPTLTDNPYIFADETQVDDLTWSFEDDQGNTVVYSILIDDENNGVSIANSDADKATNNVVRNGPISMSELGSDCDRADFSRDPEGGWYPVDTANVRRVFQVDAYVQDPDNNRVAALEFQQDRQASRGNKWGAWFRTDLEIYPGPNFMWNGAMHTEGSLIAKDKLHAHLVSSPYSCVFSKEASEITTAEYLDDETNPDFEGQFVFGVIGTDTFTGGDARFHLYNDADPMKPIKGGTAIQLNADTDSIQETTAGLVSQIALDEFELFSNNVSASRGNGWTPDDAAWDGKDLNAKRLKNDKTPIPFLDDTYRADNRFGPKPEYKDQNPDSFNLIAMGVQIGDEIPAGRDDLIGNAGGDDDSFGLDGYWERRALAKGTRTIVGQRLELGNAFGWQGADDAEENKQGDFNGDGTINAADAALLDFTDPIDPTFSLSEPLYPATKALEDSDDYSEDDNPDIIRQNRTLRDNLAAAQAMAVYHYGYEAGELPLACVAVTSHHGTEQAFENSRTFNTISIDNDDVTGSFYDIDFLTGKGTNGWEFPFVADTDAEFAAMIGPNDPMGRALRNLAYFAGDPEGGAPSFTPVQDGNIHPYPYMSMWGDFSMLRRILIEEGTGYAELSPADKSVLHTAACTISMLAYSLDLQNQKIDGLDSIYDEIEDQFSALGSTNLSQFAGEISKLMDGSLPNGEFDDAAVRSAFITAGFEPPTPRASWVDKVNNAVEADAANYIEMCKTIYPGGDPAGYQRVCDAPDYYGSLGRYDALGNPIPATVEEIKTAVLTTVPVNKRTEIEQKFALLESFVNNQLTALFQPLRDRTLGFKFGAAPIPDPYSSSLVDWDPETGATNDVRGGNTTNLNANSSYALRVGCDPDIFDGLMAPSPTSVNNGLRDEIAALSLTFCNVEETALKAPKYPALYYLFPVVNHGLAGADTTGTAAYDFNHTQPASEEYIADAYIQAEDEDYIYQAILPGQDGLPAAFSTIDLEAGLTNLAGAGPRSRAEWELPSSTTNLTGAPNIIFDNGTNVAVPFMDHEFYEGRELMNLRMLNYDLQLLTTDTRDWLADDDTGAVIYAFREDAIREDEIVRPVGDDPDITERANLISRKPVDFIADPERRAHGFMLERGADLNRGSILSGMTFVSDNNVFIKGDFNLHSTNGTPAGIIEEFSEKMQNVALTNQGAYSNAFYGRKNLNNDFATVGSDTWRPVEVLGDAVGFLSDNFVEGEVDDVFGFGPANNTSYLATRRPDLAAVPSNWWYHEGNSLDSPVEFDRNGHPLYCSGGLDADLECVQANGDPKPLQAYGDGDGLDFRSVTDNDRSLDLVDAAPVFINATTVTGVVPSRSGQSYGGLHNLPHLIEDWDGVDLSFSGAFFQLNFSTSATAPWDADPSNGGAFFNFYQAPNRRWGYDVGLLYAPAGPVARRFVSLSSNRSEFYRELPATDPYIERLKAAIP